MASEAHDHYAKRLIWGHPLGRALGQARPVLTQGVYLGRVASPGNETRLGASQVPGSSSGGTLMELKDIVLDAT
jgi:hypothetical protein